MQATSLHQAAFENLPFDFTPAGRLRIQAAFDEPDMSSDGGALLIREVAGANGIVDAMASVIRDDRFAPMVDHPVRDLIMQRMVQICHGYEDANDCDKLKDDLALKVAVGRLTGKTSLASQPTMTRFENNVTKRDLIRLFYAFIENFLNSYPSAPPCMIIDMDPTTNRVYGAQQLALFNAHYDEYCLMPFHVYEGMTGKLIATLLRPGKTPTKDEIIGLLKRIVKKIRLRFPKVPLIFRADSHHTKPEVLDWLEANHVHYVLGMATNQVLVREVQPLIDRATAHYKNDWKTFRGFHSFSYAAGTWDQKRRIIARVEATTMGTDSRFIVTDLEQAGAKMLYETVYCGRGNAELMIKEHKCFLKSSRTSCTSALANQFRLFLHSAAYVIMHSFRSTVLKGTELAKATFETIRLRLLKVAARVEFGKTFIRFHLPAASPAAPLFRRTAELAAALRGT
jgi:hypothetical protein